MVILSCSSVQYVFTKFGSAYLHMYTQIRIKPGCVFGRAHADFVDKNVVKRTCSRPRDSHVLTHTISLHEMVLLDRLHACFPQ